jgi:hypothetical protein
VVSQGWDLGQTKQNALCVSVSCGWLFCQVSAYSAQWCDVENQPVIALRRSHSFRIVTERVANS